MIFNPSGLTPAEQELRQAVRDFLATTLPSGYRPGLGFATPHDPEFSKKLGAMGWVGMTIPREFGGAGATYSERFVVVEELLAAGAPLGAHWVSDRQIAASLMSFGTDDQRREFLPGIAAGECYFSLGMSEPGSGSDLASVRTTARPVDGGWVVNGTKVWTTNAHLNHFVLTLCRTSIEQGRHQGLSQVIVDLHASGVAVRPIHFLDGSHHFNEVVFTDVFVEHGRVLGEIGAGWTQVTSELAHERSGPDRFLTMMAPLREFVRELEGGVPGPFQEVAVGRIHAKLWAVRQLGLAVARALDTGLPSATEAALVKDIGTTIEQEIIELLRLVSATPLDPGADSLFQRLLSEAVATGPSFTIRGGTTEILRSIASKGLVGSR
jgi:alkylation response protein AidB-like acyl-CoA dehydrogenase